MKGSWTATVDRRTKGTPSAADNDPYSYLEVYRIGFPLQAARPKFRPSSEALACLNNQNFSKVCYRVKPANAQPNRMFAHSSYTKHSALSVLSLKVTWRLYRSQPYGDLRRLGDYATAFTSMQTTHWIARTGFERL